MIKKTDKDTIAPYLTDASNFKGTCSAVYIPESIDELKEAIIECKINKEPITVSGAGTGLTGGRVPKGGVVISTERLNKIINIDTQKNIAIVQSGVLNRELETEALGFNLFLPPNPTEKDSSLGGNASTNASGSRTFKYGPMRKWITALKVILADGEEVHLRRGENILSGKNLSLQSINGKEYNIEIIPLYAPNVKNAAGYYLREGMDAIDLFIGSEGTLGIISELEISLLSKPEKVLGALIYFDDLNKLFGFISFIRNLSRFNNKTDYRQMKDISARLIEYFDPRSLALLRAGYPDVPENTAGAVWIEQEYAEENEDILIENWYKTINDYTLLGDYTRAALSEKEHRELTEFRHDLPAKVSDIIAKNNLRKVGTDVAVPQEYFRELYEFIVQVLKSKNLDHLIWGHFGDCHIHANVLPQDHSQLMEAVNFYDKCIAQTLQFGGTISAEHGIGKIKPQYLLRMYGQIGINAMKKVKSVLDPNNILGRGNMFL